MHTQTIHAIEDGEQVTRRVVEYDGEEYEFDVDLDAAEDADEDGHSFEGDRNDVPTQVEDALTEFGAGPSSTADGGEN